MFGEAREAAGKISTRYALVIRVHQLADGLLDSGESAAIFTKVAQATLEQINQPIPVPQDKEVVA